MHVLRALYHSPLPSAHLPPHPVCSLLRVHTQCAQTATTPTPQFDQLPLPAVKSDGPLTHLYHPLRRACMRARPPGLHVCEQRSPPPPVPSTKSALASRQTCALPALRARFLLKGLRKGLLDKRGPDCIRAGACTTHTPKKKRKEAPARATRRISYSPPPPPPHHHRGAQGLRPRPPGPRRRHPCPCTLKPPTVSPFHLFVSLNKTCVLGVRGGQSIVAACLRRRPASVLAGRLRHRGVLL